MTKENVLRHLKLILEIDQNTLNKFDVPHEALKGDVEALKEAIKLIEEQEPNKDLHKQRGLNPQDVLELCDLRDKYKREYERQEGTCHIKGYDTYVLINYSKLQKLIKEAKKNEE